MKYKKLFYSIVLLILFIIGTIIITKYIRPIMVTTALILVSLPLYKMLRKRDTFGEKASAIISIVFINCLFFIVLLFIGTFLFDKGVSFINDELSGLLLYISEIYKKIIPFQSLNDMDAKNRILNTMEKFLKSGVLKKGAIHTTDGLLTYFVGNIIAYFVLADIKSVALFIIELIGRENYMRVRKKFYEMSKLIKIIIYSAFINMIIVIIGFKILSIKNCISLGIICAILDIIPYIGTFIVFVPLTLYYFYIKNHFIVIGLLTLYIILFLTTQIIQGKFMSCKLNIPPIPLILAIYIGTKNFGIIGMITGVLYVITCNEFVFEKSYDFDKIYNAK
ncbi:AI-2E family transporter [Clostridium sp. CTA-19]